MTVTLSDDAIDSLAAMLLQQVPEVPAEFANEIIEEAAWTLLTLLDGQFHSEMCVVDQYKVVSGCREVCLDLGPVEEVTAVEWYDPCTADLIEVSSGNWCLTPPRTLKADCLAGEEGVPNIPTNVFLRMLAQGFCPPCDCGGSLLRVSYCADSNLPPGANRAILNYAAELGKQFTGQPCNLPQRLQTITRQGVSWTVLDPGTHIDRGLTGVDVVDNWLIVANRMAGGQIIDPLCGMLVSRTVVSVESPTIPAIVGEPAWVPIRIYQGDDFALTIRIRQDDEPVDITGDVFAAQIRDGFADDAPILVSLTITVDDAPNGVLTLSLTDAQTALIEPDEYRWDFQRTVGVDTTTLLAGPAVVSPEVTR